MSSPAVILAQYLAAQGIGTFGGDSLLDWSVAYSREPVSPDNAITLYDTGGSEPDTDELDILRTSIQVRGRGIDYTECYAKMEEIRDLLILPAPLITGGSHFIGVKMTSDISTLYYDEKERAILIANYEAERVRETA